MVTFNKSINSQNPPNTFFPLGVQKVPIIGEKETYYKGKRDLRMCYVRLHHVVVACGKASTAVALTQDQPHGLSQEHRRRPIIPARFRV